jgi:release factor glutamine methyltransferase
MSNSKVLFQQLVRNIHLAESQDEVESIAYFILEHELGLTRTDVMVAKYIESYNKESFDKIIARINNHEPVQYILGEADFFGRKFYVNSSVLIPRQETELLIDEILKLDLPVSPKILDVGTGSGCIGITLALDLVGASVTATDISNEALQVAEQNASTLKASIQFLQHDILRDPIQGNYDMIVSNPPYISFEEKSAMKRNVLDHEPHLALFSEPDTLLFYKNIAIKSRKTLTKKGMVAVEINEHFGILTREIFQKAGFSRCIIVKDLQNKDRIIIAQ